MPKNSIDPKNFAIITSPIPLLALYGGIMELIVAALVLKIEPQYQVYLIFGAIGLPLVWLIIIFILIAKYHQNLYAPKDFINPDQFLATLPASVKKSVSQGTLGDPTNYAPFKLSDNTFASTLESWQNDSIQSHIKHFFDSISVPELLAMHAWFNEKNSHSLAFQTMSLAIAKKEDSGTSASKNYSFASASLRKLKRLVEAQAFAILALQFNPDNLDAKYNLALIYKLTNDREIGLQFAREVNSIGGEYYKSRLQDEFPELRDEITIND